jgi:hypothetical protein
VLLTYRVEKREEVCTFYDRPSPYRLRPEPVASRTQKLGSLVSLNRAMSQVQCSQWTTKSPTLSSECVKIGAVFE